MRAALPYLPAVSELGWEKVQGCWLVKDLKGGNLELGARKWIMKERKARNMSNEKRESFSNGLMS